MEKKFDRMEAFAGQFKSGQFEREYHGYFVLFNQGEYYEAHDVLEHLWLQRRGTEEFNFFKALIQYAGCFVHLKKGKTGPALRLFRLCRSYFLTYPAVYRGVDITALTASIDRWVEELGNQEKDFDFSLHPPPRLHLVD